MAASGSWLRAGCLFVLALCLGMQATAVRAERWVVGPEGAPLSLQQALARAQDGDVIELLSGSYTGQTLLIEQRRLTLRGVGARPVFNGEGKVGTPRALWTVRGGEVTVENVEFRGARSQDAEGAGIRLEGGVLSLRDCAFYDNEHGLLATTDARAELRIERTQFGAAPRVEGRRYHLLDIGRIAKLTVQGSRFQQGFEGHMIKSRARETTIAYNFIHDGNTGGSSYQVDLPVGGVATLIGNVIGQSPKAQNRVMVAYGAEGTVWPKNTLHMAHNTLINGLFGPAWFLRVWRDRLPADTQVLAVNNLLVGPGLFWLGASGHFEGNYPATAGMLTDSATYAFELPPDSIWRGRGVDPRDVLGVDLSPKAEFTFPMGMSPLAPGRTAWSPGAFQK
jgi:hypothetical protein